MGQASTTFSETVKLSAANPGSQMEDQGAGRAIMGGGG
jgi:hypothetical protein